MNKCVHNASITDFCIKANCTYATAGGCFRCFIQDHAHVSNSAEKITLEELQVLMKKYLFSKRVKPQCLNIQQSFYNYFREFKAVLTQIINNLDQLCKNVVNNIGFPYLSEQKHFKIYKRIKNQDLTKINPKQLLQFVKSSRQISQVKIIQLQEKLYIEQINKSYQMIQKMHQTFDTIFPIFQLQANNQNLKHKNMCNQNFQKIKDIVQKVEAQTGSSIIKKIEHQQLKSEFIGLQNKQSERSRRNSQRMDSMRPQPIDFKKNNPKIQSKMHQPSLKFEQNPTHNQSNKNQSSEQALKQHKAYRQRRKSTVANQHQLELIKIQSPKKQTKPIMKPTPKKPRRQRRNSIDNQLLLKQNNLEKKVAELKKNKHQAIFPEESECTQSSKQIMNYDLPQAQSQEKIQQVKDFQVVPITRKLDQDVQQNQITQCHSPLMRRKKQYQNQKVLKESKKSTPSSTASKTMNPYIVSTPLHPSPHGTQTHKINDNILKKDKKLPQLSQADEISYMLLTKALALNTQQAITILQKALEQSENNLSAAQYLSFLYLQSYKYKKCLDLCQKYLRKLSINKKQDVQESFMLFICNKSGALNALGRYSETVKSINQYEGENQTILKNLANAYLSLGKYNQAIPIYEKALRDCCDDDLYYNLSVCLFMKQDYMHAKFTLQSALSSQPHHPQYKQLQKQILKHLSQKNKQGSKYRNTPSKKY